MDDGDPDAALAALEQDVAADAQQASWGDAFSARWRAPLMVGVGLAVFQQITGIATLVAVAWVDRLGRKPLLLAGLVGMGVSLTVVGFAFRTLGEVQLSGSDQGPSDAGAVTLVALVVYIASFAFSMGPVVWTMINEIYPRELRGRMVSIATAANWLSAWLVSQFFLTLTDSIGEPATFWLFAFFCAVAFLWIWRSVPETKDRTLEQIEQMWTAER
jgi:MFS family permease